MPPSITASALSRHRIDWFEDSCLAYRTDSLLALAMLNHLKPTVGVRIVRYGVISQHPMLRRRAILSTDSQASDLMIRK